MEQNDGKNNGTPETKMTVLPASTKRDEMLQRAEEDSINFMNPKTWAMMESIAKTFIQSGALPKGIDTFPKLMMVLQAGVEAGMRPLQAINSFYIVNGKVSMYGEQCIAQVLKAGHTVEFKDCNAQTATCKITRKDNNQSLEATFTIQMAKERGLTSKGGPWVSAPDNMLKFKAFHSIAKFIVPEALHGIELGEVIEAETIHREGHVEVMPNKSVAQTQRKSTEPAKSLEDALNEPDEKPAEEAPVKTPRKRATKTVKKEEPKVEAPTEGESNAAKLMKQGMAKAKSVEPVAENMGDPSKETDQEKFERLTEEGKDRRLTPDEAKFITEYPARKANQNRLV